METSLNHSNISINNYKNLIIGFIVFIVSVLITVFATLPFYNKNTENKALIESKKIELSSLNQKISQLEGSKRLLGSIEETSKLLDQVVPEKDDIPVVMTMIQLLAKESGVKINSFSYGGLTFANITPITTASTEANSATSTPPAAVAQSTINDAFTMNISLSGKFSSILDFIKKIEGSRRLVDISNFSYNTQTSQAQDANFTDVITTQVLLTAYFKDFVDTPTSGTLDKYLTTIEKLKALKHTQVDLGDIQIGKDNPFSTTNSTSDAESSAQGVGTTGTNGAGFFNNDNSESGINVIETEESASSNDSASTEDVEAQEGDLNQILLDLIEQEQGNSN